MIPAERQIIRVMDDTGMDRLQAVRHLQAREELQRRSASRRLEGMRGWL